AACLVLPEPPLPDWPHLCACHLSRTRTTCGQTIRRTALTSTKVFVNRETTIRQLYAWPNIANPIIFNNVSNGLNGFQFSYDVPPQQMQVVVQAYSSANLAMYDDAAWAMYRLGEVFNVKDPVTSQPATRNQWYASKNPAPASPPTDRANPYYSDISI